ncbi:MAG: sensor histidine kinase [Faecalibacterium sp.]|jgi:signal transduction histidine kinase|nr:sensor histidine kinase [Faecalibacterium sp.]
MLKSWLARQKGAFGLPVLAAGIYSIVAYLYHIPLEPVLYTFILVGAAAAAYAALSFSRYARHCREIEQLLPAAEEAEPTLPETSDRLEGDYQQMLHLVCENRAALAASAEARRHEMLDYYTLWAHQIKTPIAAMHLLLQAYPDGTDGELDAELFKIEQYVEMVLSYLRLGGETNDFVLRREPLDDILHAAVRKFARLFVLKRITLEYRDTGMMVLTDAKWMRFLVEQILSNALKYTPRGGNITLRVENNTLVIADNGIGIRAEDLPRIFEKGFTGYNGRKDQKATGLGLYLCSQTAKKLNVSLAAASTPGKGTKLRIGLCTESPEYE